jgi:hypothetical protein
LREFISTTQPNGVDPNNTKWCNAEMELFDYLANLPIRDRRGFATRCKVSIQHFRNIKYGLRPVSDQLAAAIERESGGLVTCEEAAPHVTWRRVKDKAWPWHPEGKPLVDVMPAEVR